MSRKPRTRRAALLVFLAIGVLCWAWSPTFWTSQARAEFPAATTGYRTALAAVCEAAPAALFVHMGHRAGSFEEFAKNLNRELPAEPRPVTELMDRAFRDLGLTAIEIDVRPSPLDERSLVVVHDRIEPQGLTANARAYAQRNTLRKLLSHYLREGYHRLGKRITIELKAPPGELDADAEQAVQRIAAALGDVLAGRKDAAEVRGRIDLISFSYAALGRLREALGPAAPSHPFLQIVTSNRFPEWVFELQGGLPRFDEALQARLRETPWLRGVFFDPRFVEGFARLFNGINAQREQHGLRPLDLYVSTYSHDLQGLVERLSAEGEPLRHVRGLVYQIRKG